jgi:hypothetical protein
MARAMPQIDNCRRAEQALNLRAEDYTWQKISDMLGYRSHEGARLLVRRLRLDASTVVRVEAADVGGASRWGGEELVSRCCQSAGVVMASLCLVV